MAAGEAESPVRLERAPERAPERCVQRRRLTAAAAAHRWLRAGGWRHGSDRPPGLPVPLRTFPGGWTLPIPTVISRGRPWGRLEDPEPTG